MQILYIFWKWWADILANNSTHYEVAETELEKLAIAISHATLMSYCRWSVRNTRIRAAQKLRRYSGPVGFFECCAATTMPSNHALPDPNIVQPTKYVVPLTRSKRTISGALAAAFEPLLELRIPHQRCKE
jgi:hypothetical protein